MDSKIINDKTLNTKIHYSYLHGEILTISDGILMVSGLDNVCLGSIVNIGVNKYKGLVMGLEEDYVLIAMLDSTNHVLAGETVVSEGRMLEIPVGRELLGRVVDLLGNPLDNLGPINSSMFYPLENSAPSVMERERVNSPFETGIRIIDALIPIGKGQRELIIGDRKTGKTQIALDTIVNQKDTGVKCVYVAIGKSSKEIALIVDTLTQYNCLQNTVIVFASSEDSAIAQVYAPFAGCAIAEYFMNHGENSLVIYDDLTKHAWAYRQISLLLRRTPGREAYPGDMFYIHARLLERSAHVNPSYVARKSNNIVLNKDGSMTALPILETQEGDISSFIATNVISITDGQIVLNTSLSNKNIKFPIDTATSVSRVGQAAQVPLIRQLSGKTRLYISKYYELEEFTRISSELDESTKSDLALGVNTVEILKQKAFSALSRAELAITLMIIRENIFEGIAAQDVKDFESFFHKDIKVRFPECFNRLNSPEALSCDEFNTCLNIFKTTKIRFNMTFALE